MTQSIEIAPAKKSLPLATDAHEHELLRLEAEERSRLGLETVTHWVDQMTHLSFSKSEKPNITLLIGGLTMAQDYLIEGALRHLGYNVVAMDCPDNDALRVGKEFGNRSQCNPTYFTVGNLVKHLISLRDEKGMSTEEIIEKYVFLTAGACGPCRFGMYTTEYRKALRDAGFDGFRVMLFQQQGGMSQATGDESGLELTPPFFLALVKGILCGDVLNAVGYRLRPYELEPGATDRALAEARKLCYDALREGRSALWALWQGRKLLAQVKVDRLQARPKVSIIGEFWAMTTEGDGNYKLQRFLEEEGGEADIQLVAAWLLYNIWEVAYDTEHRAELRGVDDAKQGLADLDEFGVFRRKLLLWAAERVLRATFQVFANAGGLHGYHLPDMDAVAEAAAPHYHNELRGGEGHMEVGKLILNVKKNKANMTLSVKPFGCMPSSGVSDGVQALITEKLPGAIFCAVETSGDGEVNFQSRVQMYLFKAKQVAASELDQALEATGLSLEQVRDFLARNPGYAAALHAVPHHVASTAANLVYEVAQVYGTSRWQRILGRARALFVGTTQGVQEAGRRAPSAARNTVSTVSRGTAELLEIAVERAPGAAQSMLTRWRRAA